LILTIKGEEKTGESWGIIIEEKNIRNRREQINRIFQTTVLSS